VVAAVDSATVIEVGDCVWQDRGDAKPASDQARQGTESDDRMVFKDHFLGIAMQRSRAGDTAPTQVATTGVFEFDCRDNTFKLGDLVGVDENTAGDALLNQQVDSVSTSAEAIGRAARREATATTSVLVDVRSTIMSGGV